MNAQPDQQAELERMVTRIAQRAADNVSESVADLGRKLALAQESLAGQAQIIEQLQKDTAEKDAELARAHQVAGELRQRIAALENPDPAAGEDPTEG